MMPSISLGKRSRRVRRGSLLPCSSRSTLRTMRRSARGHPRRLGDPATVSPIRPYSFRLSLAGRGDRPQATPFETVWADVAVTDASLTQYVGDIRRTAGARDRPRRSEHPRRRGQPGRVRQSLVGRRRAGAARDRARAARRRPLVVPAIGRPPGSPATTRRCSTASRVPTTRIFGRVSRSWFAPSRRSGGRKRLRGPSSACAGSDRASPERTPALPTAGGVSATSSSGASTRGCAVPDSPNRRAARTRPRACRRADERRVACRGAVPVA